MRLADAEAAADAWPSVTPVTFSVDVLNRNDPLAEAQQRAGWLLTAMAIVSELLDRYLDRRCLSVRLGEANFSVRGRREFRSSQILRPKESSLSVCVSRGRTRPDEFKYIVAKTDASARDNSYPLARLESQHCSAMILGAVQGGAATCIRAPTPIPDDPEIDPELVIGKLLCWIFWLEIGKVWRDRNSDRHRARVLDRHFKLGLIPDSIIGTIQ